METKSFWTEKNMCGGALAQRHFPQFQSDIERVCQTPQSAKMRRPAASGNRRAQHFGEAA